MVPLFPLPNVVLFPRVFLPLHIFEPRYREMVRDALAGDRIIGMVLLRDAGAAGDVHNPAVFPTGCAGLITHCERLPDGRYNIVLRGLYKFRVVEEDRSRSYRRASVETLAEPDDADGLREARRRLERLLTGTGSNLKLPAGMGRRRPGERAVAVSRIRPDREAGAAGAQRPERPLPGAGRSAGDAVARRRRFPPDAGAVAFSPLGGANRSRRGVRTACGRCRPRRPCRGSVRSR